MALIEVRLRPTGPWRTGYRGDRERVEVVYHSDALFSAITHAMRALGWMDEWLDATARTVGEPAVRLGSLFPFVGKTRLVAPPKTVWPPSGRGQLHLSGAKLVPLEVLRQGIQDEARWEVDGECECLLPANGSAPFRIVVRESAAVDRLTGVADGHKMACLEFAPNAGLWGVFSTSDKTWESRVKAAFKLLADSGFGGERSRGWGRSAEPLFNDATHLFPAAAQDTAAWWLLSLYSPDETDAVDWAKSEHAVTLRGGWTDSPAGVALKKQLRLVEEGSVLAASSLRGRAVDVAPEGFAHPVYRAGFALAVPVPVPVEAAPKKKAPKVESAVEVVTVEQPVVGEEPVVPEAPVVAETPVVAEVPAAAEELVATEEPVVEAPLVAETPLAVETPVAPEVPVAAVEPVVAETPVAAEAPVVAGTPVDVEDRVVSEAPVAVVEVVETPAMADKPEPVMEEAVAAVDPPVVKEVQA